VNEIKVIQSEPGKEIIVRVVHSRFNEDAWIGLFKAGSGDNEHGDRWKWMRDVDVSHITLPVQGAGEWSVRLFKDGGYDRISSLDFQVTNSHSSVDETDAESNNGSAIAFVIGLIMFVFGLPLFIIGNISSAPDRLAMLIPGAILFGVGAFVSIAAAVIGMGFGKRATTSEQDLTQQSSGKYVFVPEQMTWNEHSHRAQAMGGHLASITNGIENEQITRISGGAPVWIGGIRKGSDNGPGADHWYWSDGRPWSYTNWNPGEPNNYGGHENRVHLGLQARGTWNDVPEGWSGPAVYLVPITASALTTSARPSSPPEIDLLDKFFRSKLEQSKPADSGVPEFSSYLTKK